MNVKEKLQALLNAANNATGETDTTLTDAVQRLVDGYGGGSGGTGNYKIFHAKTTVASQSTSVEYDTGLSNLRLSDCFEVVFMNAKYENHEYATSHLSAIGQRYGSPSNNAITNRANTLWSFTTGGGYDYWTNGVSISINNGIVEVSNTKGVYWDIGTELDIIVIYKEAI